MKTGRRFALLSVSSPVWSVDKAKVIATFDDGAPAIIANRFGKGMTVSFFTDAGAAARDFPELVRDVIDYALKSAGTALPVDIVGANENIDLAVGKTAEGLSAAIINHNSNNMEVILRPAKSQVRSGGRWFDLVSGTVIAGAEPDRSLRLTIPGNGFRAIELR